MKRLVLLALALALAATSCTTTERADPIRVGALYPLSGSQGPGGVDEHRGAALAADLVNDGGGVGGRPIELVSIDVPAADAAPAAVQALRDDGVELVAGLLRQHDLIGDRARDRRRGHGVLGDRRGRHAPRRSRRAES